MKLRHFIDIMEHTVTDKTPLGKVRTWTKRETLPCLVRLESLEGRSKYQQIGHSEVNQSVVFRMPISLAMKENMFRYNGKWLEIVEPPGNPDGVNRYVTISVRSTEEPT